MGDKAARKKGVSKVFKDLKIVEFENPEEDEELVKYYQNKNFVAPLPRKLETLFEGSRRGFSKEGELNLGKGLDKRYIEDYEFWKQNDKDKNRRRKVMVQKLFKGRKNPKPKPLTAKLEKKLKKMIDNVPEFVEDSSLWYVFIYTYFSFPCHLLSCICIYYLYWVSAWNLMLDCSLRKSVCLMLYLEIGLRLLFLTYRPTLL